VADLTDHDLKINKSKPPLRWFANFCGDIAGWAILRISYQDELENFGWRYKVYSTIWKITWPVYYRFGTVYEFSFDMSGDGWNDYDEDGVPYWENPDFINAFVWDYEDQETGDAFRLIKKEK
jgi:hypothetical protein